MKSVILITWALVIFNGGVWQDLPGNHRFRSQKSCEALGVEVMKRQPLQVTDYICVDMEESQPQHKDAPKT